METKFPTQPKCGVHNCGRPQVAKGLCEMHYKRQKRHGTVSDEVGMKTVDGMLMSRHPLYNTWRNMTRTNAGRDICEKWKDFSEFVKDAGGKPTNAFALKRIDASKPFEIGNVRWVIRASDVTPDERMSKAEAARETSTKNRLMNPDYYRNYDLYKKYRITLDEYNQMFKQQHGVCAICKNPETRIDKRINRVSNLAVDHCHDTNKVRGLLCHACNAMLGQAGDSIDRLRSGIEYLSLHQSQK